MNEINPQEEEVAGEITTLPILTTKRCSAVTIKGTKCLHRASGNSINCRIHEKKVCAVTAIPPEELCFRCFTDTGEVVQVGLIKFYFAMGQECKLCEAHFKELCSANNNL